jgi:hypothetical protein
MDFLYQLFCNSEPGSNPFVQPALVQCGAHVGCGEALLLLTAIIGRVSVVEDSALRAHKVVVKQLGPLQGSIVWFTTKTDCTIPARQQQMCTHLRVSVLYVQAVQIAQSALRRAACTRHRLQSWTPCECKQAVWVQTGPVLHNPNGSGCFTTTNQ